MIETLKNKISTKEILRRDIRYHLFRIRDGIDLSQYVEYNDYIDLKKYIESQFSNQMSWDNFTFEWDVSSIDPLKVITQFEWDGKIDKFLNKCDPPAFTKQTI